MKGGSLSSDKTQFTESEEDSKYGQVTKSIRNVAHENFGKHSVCMNSNDWLIMTLKAAIEISKNKRKFNFSSHPANCRGGN